MGRSDDRPIYLVSPSSTSRDPHAFDPPNLLAGIPDRPSSRHPLSLDRRTAISFTYAAEATPSENAGM